MLISQVTKCTFHKYGPSGTIQTIDGLCILPLNIINEKIYVFLWFWFIFVAVISAIHVRFKPFLKLSNDHLFFSLSIDLPLCSFLVWEPTFWELAPDLSHITKSKTSVTRKQRETGSFFISLARTWIPFFIRSFWKIFIPRWSRITMAFCNVYISLFFRNKAFVECDNFGIIGPF